MAALALSSANGLLLKGGKEASHTNRKLMEIVTQSLSTIDAANAMSLVSKFRLQIRPHIHCLHRWDAYATGPPHIYPYIPSIRILSCTQVSTREEISDLLQMESHIDLIIPRGSSELIRSIQERSQHIPVMGHAEGVCHVYVDEAADLDKAIKIGESVIMICRQMCHFM